MPSISLKNVAAGVANALDGLQFQEILEPGALVTIYASTPTAGGNINYDIGSESFLNAAQVNIEGSADVVSANGVDLILDREAVPPGKQFLAVNAQICNVLVIIEPLPLI